MQLFQQEILEEPAQAFKDELRLVQVCTYVNIWIGASFWPRSRERGFKRIIEKVGHMD